MSNEIPSATVLKRLLKTAGITDKEVLYLRLHRAISWIRCAEQQESIDLQFISLWIAFNSLYADNPSLIGSEFELKKEKEIFKHFIEKIDDLNARGDLYHFVWNRFTNEIKSIIQNKFLNSSYWLANSKGVHFDEIKLEAQFAKAFKHLEKHEPSPILSMALDNLYVLRNQLIHGYATHGSMVNRVQIRHGINFLKHLNSIVLLTMLEHPSDDWGGLNYPVVDKQKFFK